MNETNEHQQSTTVFTCSNHGNILPCWLSSFDTCIYTEISQFIMICNTHLISSCLYSVKISTITTLFCNHYLLMNVVIWTQLHEG